MILDVLMAAATTLILTQSKLFAPLRGTSSFLNCPLCIGVWMGWLWYILRNYPKPNLLSWFGTGSLVGALALTAALVWRLLER